MQQVLLPAIRPDGVMDGGFVVGESVDFSQEGATYVLPTSGNVVILSSRTDPYGFVYYVAVLTSEQAYSREHAGWAEYAENNILNKDSERWIGGGSAGLQTKVAWDTSLMGELLKGTRYTATIPVPTYPTSEGDNVSDPVYGSSHYWSAGKLMPPELIIPPSADPSLTVNDIQDFQYVHNQLTPSATWVVTHNLGRHPAVAVADPQGNGLTVQVDYVSLDALHLIFSTDQSGSCRCV